VVSQVVIAGEVVHAAGPVVSNPATV
jgi:hypothetical protein